MRKVLFVAGEASGDLHAAGVAGALRRIRPELLLAAVGGRRLAEQGVQLLRVHDVPETIQALRVWRGLRDTALAPG